MRDDEVPGWWRGLGLSGLVDTHVHFLPDPVMHAVWDYFDQAERHPNVHLDTTMAYTPFTEALMPMPPELRPRLAGLRDRPEPGGWVEL